MLYIIFVTFFLFLIFLLRENEISILVIVVVVRFSYNLNRFYVKKDNLKGILTYKDIFVASYNINILIIISFICVCNN